MAVVVVLVVVAVVVVVVVVLCQTETALPRDQPWHPEGPAS